jgi:hypothetical protein
LLLALSFGLGAGALQGADSATPLAELARGRLPYLLLDPASRTLSVEISGHRFDSLRLDSAEMIAAPRGVACEPTVRDPIDPSPQILAVEEDATAALRLRIAPELLSSTQDDPQPATAAAEIEPAPADYRVGLAGNWSLRVSSRPPTAIDRLRRALHSGWQGLRGRHSGCELRISLDPDDARSLHHLMRPGARIAILAPERRSSSR